jgi:fused signal recognition particle receptor
MAKASWLSRLTSGLSKTADQIGGGIRTLMRGNKLDAQTIADLEELLIQADLGTTLATRLSQSIAHADIEGEEDVRAILAEQISTILEPYAKPLAFPTTETPIVILICGVNGNGKTTTIGKIAAALTAQGRSVMVVACDTFRAAAVEQLQVWAERAGAQFFRGTDEADPASVAFQAYEQAIKQGTEIVFIDTAGRLHNKANLMAELQKILRILARHNPDAPHHILLTLDATTGQNALQQVDTFREMVGITGLIVTKLDGSAKAGIVVALAEKYHLPIHAIGVGEQIDDLKAFVANEFARSLVGL